jgi:hypothetical protein
MKSSMESPQKAKVKTTMSSSDTIPGICSQRNINQDTLETLAHQCLLQHCSQQPSYGNNQDALQLMDGIRKLHTYTHTHIYEFYSVIRKNDTMWFEGKWMQLEDIMLSEVSYT